MHLCLLLFYNLRTHQGNVVHLTACVFVTLKTRVILEAQYLAVQTYGQTCHRGTRVCVGCSGNNVGIRVLMCSSNGTADLLLILLSTWVMAAKLTVFSDILSSQSSWQILFLICSEADSSHFHCLWKSRCSYRLWVYDCDFKSCYGGHTAFALIKKKKSVSSSELSDCGKSADCSRLKSSVS